MGRGSQENFEQEWIRVPALISVAVALAALGSLAIWLMLPALKTFSGASMKPNTALGIGAASCALWYLRTAAERRSKRHTKLGRYFALFVILIGLVTACEYVLHLNLGIDEFIANDSPQLENSLHPGRMSPIAAALMAFTGFGLYALSGHQRRVYWSSIFVLPVFFISTLVVIGYVYDARMFFQFGPYIRISWQSALCFGLLSLGTLYSRPNEGPVRVLTAPGLGGMIARRLLPIMLFVPILTGYVWIYMRNHDWFNREVGVSLFVILINAIFIIVVGIVASRLETVDRQRRETEQSLQMAVRARDEFLSIASHELKTPLTTLKLQAQIFQRRAKREDPLIYEPDTVNELVNAMENQATRIARLVDDMLDVARIRSGKLKLSREELCLADVVRESVERIRMQFDHLGKSAPEFHCSGATTGSWDRLRIEQVVANLLTNAIRYGEGRPVIVKLLDQGEEVVLTVEDHGIGITESDQSKIFNRFERAVDANEVSGLGLGLFITKQIVAAHGGDISVQSHAHQGSVFTVRLPKGATETSSEIVDVS